MSRLKAIDLYSGIGGWSLGLNMAGIEVVDSFDIWEPANKTNRLNNGHPVHTANVRNLPLSSRMKEVDVIVGSPPCTQFSFSNRGGSGDLADGIEDLRAFLRIVKAARPRLWVMENVPRVASILVEELKSSGRLAAFRSLKMNVRVFDLSRFGVPQRRERCLIGNIDFDLLVSYGDSHPQKTLGAVISALCADPVADPIYHRTMAQRDLNDHLKEPFLDEEEFRINRANKLLHPIYNAMPFPERLDRGVRTITATCTRVSRESVVVEDPVNPGQVRRLTVRERASLQSFPVDFEFYGSSYAQKLKMVGNAMPPLFAYYVAHACIGSKRCDVPPPEIAFQHFKKPVELPPYTPPERDGKRFRSDRTFRFAIPSLRLKSGVRFELSNQTEGGTDWAVRFLYGTPKAIQEIPLTRPLLMRLLRYVPQDVAEKVDKEIQSLACYITSADVAHMQILWAHRGPGVTRPFDFLDELSRVGGELISLLQRSPDASVKGIDAALPRHAVTVGVSKLHKHAPTVFAGLLVGSAANAELRKLRPRRVPTQSLQARKKTFAIGARLG